MSERDRHFSEAEPNPRPFRVYPMRDRRTGRPVMIGYLDPEFDSDIARSAAMIERVRRTIIDDERDNGYLVARAEYRIGTDFVAGWDTASVDTLPKGQDAKQGLAGTAGSAVPKADARKGAA